jgi:hypothetical protein
MKDLTKKLLKIGTSVVGSLIIGGAIFSAGMYISRLDPHLIDMRSVKYAATKNGTDYFYLEMDKKGTGKIDYISRYKILGQVGDEVNNGIALEYDSYRPVK